MIDLQLSDLKGEESLWIADGWTEKFNLPLPDNTLNFKHSPEEAVKVMINDKDLLVDYLDVAIKLAKDYLSHLDKPTLYEIID
ncbi:hypothetical protein [Aerococcus urinaeequi]|uniref:hypothetical protein n=1 Tax=Aerococcus urinaeequi TaxID=51665 RepID=UPI00125738D0|nr:hypothetical protein FPV23_07185 [Carnobacterium sp. PL17RED31]